MNSLQKMKVAKLYSHHDIRIEEVSIPTPGRGDILVKMKACGVCSGDVVPWYIEAKAPLVLGHEPVGEVVEVGTDVTSFKPGDRVFMHHHVPCFTCKACRQRNWSTCPQWKASNLDPGGMAEYVRVPAHNLADTIVLPDEMSYEEGLFIEPFACSVHAMQRSGVKPGDTVVVLGLGIMGMLNIVAARHWGAASVIGVDQVDWRLKRAKQIGADQVINFSQTDVPKELDRLSDGIKADHVIVGPGSVAAMESGLQLVGKGGTLLIFTPTEPHEAMRVSPFDIYMNAITVKASYSCGPDDTRLACQLIGEGVVPVEELVTHRFPLRQTAEAFQVTYEASESLKTLVVFDD